jgi:predicted ATPase
MAPDRRPFGPGPYLLGVRRKEEAWLHGEFPFELPAAMGVESLRFDRPATFLVGENGAGKSTLVEALARVLRFDLQGGTTGTELGPRQLGDDPLAEALDPQLGANKPRESFFLRAESFYNVAARIDAKDLSSVYGGRGLHAQSHGESFLALAANRFGSDGLYVLDEPEAALSVSGALALLAIVVRAAAAGAQFIIATHSPILLACPGARLYELDDRGLTPCAYDDLDAVRFTRGFLDAPERYIRAALEDPGAD